MRHDYMGIIFDKSKSDKYKKYFTSVEELTRPFAVFSLREQRYEKQQSVLFKSWDTGKVGVPLSWNSESRTVSVDHTDSHTLVIGPTGSKKSRLVVMPLVRILGSEGESMIISDPKAEIYNRTAGFLKERDYNIFVLNLRSPMHGHRWNPLAIPYEFFSNGEVDKAYEFVNDIAENLIQSDKSDKDPFWDNSAGSFFFGLVLLLFKYCKDYGKGKEFVHMGNVVRLRNALLFGSRGEKNIPLWNYAKTDAIICSALIGTVDTANDTKSGILSVFDQKIRMFSIQPNLLDMLGANDVNMDTIGEKPTAVFLIVPDEKTGYHGLVSLFIKQSYEYMIFRAQIDDRRDSFVTGALKNRVNYILDEFSSLPTIRDFPAMVTAARSRNIRFTLVIQSKHQLIQRYKDETDTIQTNCNNWIFLTSRELQLLEELSSLCGKTLEDNPQPVLSVSDLQRLDKDRGEALLLCGRAKPCVTRLADIDVYDGNRFTTAFVLSRLQQTPPDLDYDLPLLGHTKIGHLQQELTPPPFAPMQFLDEKMNIDKMLKDIDKKLAELDAEEKAAPMMFDKEEISEEGDKD